MIIVVWKPILLSEVWSVRKLVPIQLMAGIGLAMQDLSRVQVWTKSMWVVVAEVVVAIPVRDISETTEKIQENAGSAGRLPNLTVAASFRLLNFSKDKNQITFFE